MSAAEPRISQAPIHPRRILAVLLAPLFMALVAISVINVALAAISESLDTTSTGLQWMLSGYALAFGVFLVPSGRAGDATGRRRLLVIGVGVFTLGSLVSALAPNEGTLIVARILQGIGSGLLNPQAIGLIQQHFHGQKRAAAFAMFGTTVAVATAIGPVVGGVLIELFGSALGWRMIFLLNVPIGIATMVFALRWLPQDRVRVDSKLDLDPMGTILLTAGIISFMVPFMTRGNPWVYALLGVALVMFAGWALWEKRYKQRGRQPMVDLALLQQPSFRNGIAIITVYFLGATSVWILVPVYMITSLHLSAFEASLIGLPSSIAAMFSSQLGGRYVLRLGRRLVAAGFALAFFAMVTMVLIVPLVESGRISHWWFAAALLMFGFSQGLTISPNQTLTLNAVDPRFGGVAGGVLSLGQRMGAAVGTALIPGILFSMLDRGAPWVEAFRTSVAVIIALMLGAFVLTLVDRRREKRDMAAARAAQS
ncbi:MFS transporter [Helcobacillus massiliensis]|uniref:EmrB/QacA subfamily drug resistance transporter n=1 Tax=Helcobacillus massiliensis TaxID=521392 RepID=A0A839QR73_9MICO|nr:MFS transporter [Helcobacillus massiliensis]MBB3022512.1 EmrB/QacA subfamily drug resistance transporter [Helcobacillus massiliensis]MCT1557146.1 MFS transporter [Helcobacillus massiliensis]MCT2036119.1 MFS transporter [Helcobacillus massiliensis]MCT2331250.1 MFS transporter [Helcobacillus massiliensis]